jgi:hypothetical protein
MKLVLVPGEADILIQFCEGCRPTFYVHDIKGGLRPGGEQDGVGEFFKEVVKFGKVV